MLFCRLFLEGLAALHEAGTLAFFGTLAPLSDAKAFFRALTPVRKKRWVVYGKPPFAGPKAVLAYLSRYTHRVAISSRRILAFDGKSVSFPVDDILNALASLDQADCLVHRTGWHPVPARRGALLSRLRNIRPRRDNHGDPPPCPASASIPVRLRRTEAVAA